MVSFIYHPSLLQHQKKANTHLSHSVRAAINPIRENSCSREWNL